MRYTNTLKYAFLGLLFGLFFPLLSWLIDGLIFKNLPPTASLISEVHEINPIHFVIDLAPLVLGSVFALMGYYLDKLVMKYSKEGIDYSFYEEKNKQLLKRLRIGNLLLPLIIILSLVSSYVVIRDSVSQQENDAPVINYSGRQRMLSQKIAKSALHLYAIEDEKDTYGKALQEALPAFQEAHKNLIHESATLSFSKKHANSPAVELLYDSLKPYFEGIIEGAEQLLTNHKLLTSTMTDSAAIAGYKKNMQLAIERIERNERAFLPIMDKIVFTYHREAQEKLEDASQLGLVVIILFTVLILAFAVFITRPVIEKIKKAFVDVDVANNKLAENNSKLAASEEQLQENARNLQNTNDYLHQSQKELATYITRVTKAKKMAKLAAYELYPKKNEIVHTTHLNHLLKIDEEEEITPQLLESYVHREDYTKFIKNQQHSIQSKSDTFYRFRLKTEGYKDWHWFQGATHCIINEKQEVEYIINSLQDITEIVNKEKEIENLLQEVNTQNQELQASEEELRQNTEQLQLINDNLFVVQREAQEKQRLLTKAEQLSKIGSFDTDVKSSSFSHSQNLAAIYGLEKEEMNDVRKHLKYYHPENQPEIEKNSLELAKGIKDSFSLTARFKGTNHKDWRHLKIEGTLVRDALGNPERVLGVIQDITKVFKQRQALEESQKQLESLSNNLQGIMYRSLIDENWTIQFISKGVERITGYVASDFIGNKVRSFASIIHEEDREFDAEINQAIETKLPYKIEYRLIRKNGSIIWVEESGQVVEDILNNVKYLDGVLMDITQRKQAEHIIETQTQKLLKSQKELKQQQQLLSDAEKMAKMGSYVWNLHTREIKHSENLPTIYGLEKDAVINQIIFDEIIHPDEREEHQRAISEAMMSGKREVLTTYRAKPVHLSEEFWKYYRTYSIIDYNEDGEPVALIGTAQDVSEEVKQQKIQQELLDYVKENKESLEESQRIAQMVSYDMNIVTKEIKWSDSFVQVFKVEESQIPKDTLIFQEWINKEDLPQINEAWELSITKKEEFNAVYRVNTPSNRALYVREKGYPIFDENGNFIKMKGTLQDITKAELAKKKLEKTSQQLKKQNTNLISSINYAQRIQSAMLGGTQDLKQIFKDSFVFFEPKDVVSGDFYWYNEVGTRKIVIVGDCTGHGVPGAFMSLLGTTLLNEIILQRQITTPSKILDFMQSEIRRILKQDTTGNRDGMDMAVVVVDKSVGMMEFSGAKNPLVYINKRRKKGGADTNLTLIKGDVHPIGGRTEKYLEVEYTNHFVDLEDMCAFYIYSDGYQDQFGGEKGRKFMSTKFRKLLYNTHSTSMRHQRVSLKRNLMNWMGTEYEQVDDICVMGISV